MYQVVDRDPRLLAEALESRPRVLQARCRDRLCEGSVFGRDVYRTMNGYRLWLWRVFRDPGTGFSWLPTASIARGTTA
jgi:hypothetical protein